MRQTEVVSASRVAILEQLSASIGEMNQPITALVLNAQAALQLLHAQPTDTGAVRRLLVCIVKDGLRTGDLVHRTRALIEKAPPVGATPLLAGTLENANAQEKSSSYRLAGCSRAGVPRHRPRGLSRQCGFCIAGFLDADRIRRRSGDVLGCPRHRQTA